MTRRTDWAEHTDGSAGTDGGTYGAAAAPDETDTYETDTYGVDQYEEDPSAVGVRDGGGARHGAGGARRAGGRSRGPSGGRGRRRRERAEPSTEDGGVPSSSRAEKGEPPPDPGEPAPAIILRQENGAPRPRSHRAEARRNR
ncbi:recombination regulator RecX, partial [Streptomyces olivaceus]